MFYLLDIGRIPGSIFILVWLVGRYILSLINKKEEPVKRTQFRWQRNFTEEYISLTGLYISVLDLADKIPIDSKIINAATLHKVEAHQSEELEDVYNRELAYSAREFLLDQYVYFTSIN